eukprot:jgi/Botrbrau1/4937/Bobra.0122s0019.1
MDSSVLIVTRDFGDLPLDVLIKILARVDLSTLRLSRLLCKAFRRASIPRISCLRCNCLSSDITPARLAGGLSMFPAITELHLGLALPRDASMLFLPAVPSTLRSLRLEFVGGRDAVSHSWEAIVPRLAGATQLTALAIARVAVQGSGFKLADSLTAFTALEELTLHAIPAGEAETLAEAVLQLPRLHKVQSCDVDDRFMDTVLRNASRMTRLQSLTWLGRSRGGGLEHVALLTQLTSLELTPKVRTMSSHLVQLSRLTSLQVLILWDASPNMDQLRQLVSPMTQLRELGLHSSDRDAAIRLDPLLARLPMITNLELRRPPDRALWLPVSLLPNGFASLRAVSLWIWKANPTNVVQLPKALTRLESLELNCEALVIEAFLSHLPGLRNLAELVLISFKQSARLFPGLASLRFLEEAQRLKRLVLEDVVDVLAWDDGLRYLAILTGLTELRIRQTAPAQLLTSAQVQPLAGLTRLEQLVCSRPWGGAFHSADFGRALQGRQHELGLRRCYIAYQVPDTSYRTNYSPDV